MFRVEECTKKTASPFRMTYFIISFFSLFLKKIYSIGVQLIYNVVLVQQSNSIIIYIIACIYESQTPNPSLSLCSLCSQFSFLFTNETFS